jgi:hypothetical protein
MYTTQGPLRHAPAVEATLGVARDNARPHLNFHPNLQGTARRHAQQHIQ